MANKKKASKKKASTKKKVAPKKKAIAKKKTAPKKKAPAKKKAAPRKSVSAFNRGGCSVTCLDCRRVIGSGYSQEGARNFRDQHSQAFGHPVSRIRIRCSQ